VLWAAPGAVRRLARSAAIDPDQPPTELIATCGSGVSGADPAQPVAYGADQ
jgi:hypothetical protein